MFTFRHFFAKFLRMHSMHFNDAVISETKTSGTRIFIAYGIPSLNAFSLEISTSISCRCRLRGYAKNSKVKVILLKVITLIRIGVDVHWITHRYMHRPRQSCIHQFSFRTHQQEYGKIRVSININIRA